MDNKSLDALPQTKYVSGIFMDYQMDQFLLIDKGGLKLKDGTVLLWQGIGGHINYNCKQIIPGEFRDETPHEAMEREFHEETGTQVNKKRWHCYHIKETKQSKIYFFVAFGDRTELYEVQRNFAPTATEPHEGYVNLHNIVDIYFDPRRYTYDLPYLIHMIHREMKVGMLLKLDPEGVNTSGKT